jgi:hypothetical protein
MGPQTSQVCTARCAIIYSANLQGMGCAVVQLVEALCYKSEGRRFDFQLEFFIDIILSAALWPWCRLSPRRIEYQEYFVGVKMADA